MKTIVVYKSKTGFTQKYANWIADELKCEVKTLKEVNGTMLQSYDRIIFGSYIIAGTVSSLDKMKQLLGKEKDKKLIVFVTGATALTEKKIIEQVWEKAFTEEERKHIPSFYFIGGLCYEKMGFFSKTMMKMFAKKVAKDQEKLGISQDAAISIASSFDHSSKEYIKPLIDIV